MHFFQLQQLFFGLFGASCINYLEVTQFVKVSVFAAFDEYHKCFFEKTAKTLTFRLCLGIECFSSHFLHLKHTCAPDFFQGGHTGPKVKTASG
jgi:hypothetical protein